MRTALAILLEAALSAAFAGLAGCGRADEGGENVATNSGADADAQADGSDAANEAEAGNASPDAGGDAGDAATGDAPSNAADGSDADAASGPDDAAADGADSDAPALGPGATCAVNADCESGLCKEVWPGQDPICVLSCRSQLDCAQAAGFFCGPSGSRVGC